MVSFPQNSAQIWAELPFFGDIKGAEWAGHGFFGGACSLNGQGFGFFRWGMSTDWYLLKIYRMFFGALPVLYRYLLVPY